MTGHGSSYSKYDTSRSAKLFGRVRPMHEVLGGGKGTVYCYSQSVLMA